MFKNLSFLVFSFLVFINIKGLVNIMNTVKHFVLEIYPDGIIPYQDIGKVVIATIVLLVVGYKMKID